MNVCESCHKARLNTKTAYVNGTYYKQICSLCLGDRDDEISSGAAGFTRRRDYEDMAQDTVQPWDANGKPRVEFFRLYPQQAAKMFDKATIEELKRKI